MSFYDLGTSNLVYSFQWIVEKENPKIDYIHIISWIVREDNYAINIEGDVWKIQSLYGDFALEFQWNIATDEIKVVVKKR